MMSTQDTTWLAGWLEGEGWFGLSNHSTEIHATCTDLDIIKRVATLFGDVPIYEKKLTSPKHKQAYTIRVAGSKAEEIMREILPYMGERRSSRIKELLLYREGSSQRRSNATRRRWEDPLMRQKMSEGISKRARENAPKRSTYLKALWADPEWRATRLAAQVEARK